MKTVKEIKEQIAYCEKEMLLDLDESNGDGAVLNKKVMTILEWVLDKK